jgi:hypothetical protein
VFKLLPLLNVFVGKVVLQKFLYPLYITVYSENFRVWATTCSALLIFCHTTIENTSTHKSSKFSEMKEHFLRRRYAIRLGRRFVIAVVSSVLQDKYFDCVELVPNYKN